MLYVNILSFFLSFSAMANMQDLLSERLKLYENKTSPEKMSALVTKLEKLEILNEIQKEILGREKILISNYNKYAKKSKKEVITYLNKKMDEYYKLSTTVFSDSTYILKYPESQYLLYLIKEKKINSEEIHHFDYILLYFADRMSFFYSEAKNKFELIKNETEKNKFKSILKRLVRSSIGPSNESLMTDEEKFFLAP